MAQPVLPGTADEAIANGLDWQRDGDTLVKAHRAASFAAAIEYVNQVARLAEALNHHPDIDIRWTTVHLRLTTHDVGGLSDLDLELAGQIDGLGG